MRIIGLAGSAGSGKDTVAVMILDQVSGASLAFADPLREAARAIFGLTELQMTDRVLKEQVVPYWGLSPRQILQRLGTECVREQFGYDTWLKRARLRLEALQDSSAGVAVFTDVRFPNEAQWVRDQGGVVVRIHRGRIDVVAAHASEQALPDGLVDFELSNSAGLVELRQRVNLLLGGWLEAAAPR